MANGNETAAAGTTPEERERNEIENYQVMQQRLQIIMLQKQQLQMQSDELNHAISELDKASGQVYRIVGPIVIQSKKDEVSKELQGKREDCNSKVELLDKQEERIKKNLMELRKSIEQRRK
jgi:prefoldin beta subunit